MERAIPAGMVAAGRRDDFAYRGRGPRRPRGAAPRRSGKMPALRTARRLPVCHRGPRARRGSVVVGLTPRQLEAVAVEETPRDTCVVAGPGSGKTTVLVAHFERLVESGVDPLRILAITFTDKAANNMRDKLAHKFQERAEIRGKLERAYVSTVHGFCARLLKENAVFAGLDPEFFVMDERESLREQRRAIDEVLDGMFADQPDRMRALMRGLAATDAGAEVLDAYDAIRAAGVKVGDLPHFAAPPAVDIAAAIEEVRNLRPRDWKFDQLAYLHEAQDWVERIAAALPDGPEAILKAMRSFTCELRKLKRGNRAYARLPRVRPAQVAQGRLASRTGILDCSWVLCSRARHDYRVIRALRWLVPRAQAAIRRARLRRPGRMRRVVAGGTSGSPAPPAKPIRPGADGRVSGYQWPTGQAAGIAAAAGPLLRGRRHQPVDLRFPPRRTARVPRISRYPCAGWQAPGGTG